MIVGGRIVSVKGEKKKAGEVDSLNVNLNIDDVKNEKNRTIVRYTYSIAYVPDVADLSITGEVFVEGPEQKDITDSWAKTKQLHQAFAEDLLTSVTYTGSAVGTLLAFALNINAPINVSKARLQPPQQPPKAA